MKNLDFTKALPYILAIPVFYLATVLFFSAEVVDGRVLRQGDVVQYEGMSRTSRAYTAANNEQALWNISMFSGFPEYLIAGVDEGPIHYIRRATEGFFPRESAASLFFVATFSSWIMLLCFGVNPYLSILGALAISLNSYNIVTIEAGHLTKVKAIAYAAMVLGGLKLAFSGKRALGFALTALALTLQMGANHYQITFYLIFVCGIFTISEAILAFKDQRIPAFARNLAVVVLAVGLGGLTQTARLWMTLEYSPYSIRGQSELSPLPGEDRGQGANGLDKDYAFSWSQGTFETLTLLVPGLYGGGSQEKVGGNSAFAQELEKVAGKQRVQQMVKDGSLVLPMYHGDQPFTAGPIYTGAINFFFFVLAMFVLDRRQKYWILAATLLMVFFAWGKNFAPFNFFLFDYVPGFNKFRSVSMALSLALILIPLAGMMAIQKVSLQPFNKEWQKKLLIPVASVLALVLVLFVFAGAVDVATPADAARMGQMLGTDDQRALNTFVDALHEDRTALISSDAMRSLFLILSAIGVLYAVMAGKLKRTLGLLIIGFLLVTDLWLVGKRYLHEDKFVRARSVQAHPLTPADKAILADKNPHYRVYNLTPNAFQEAGTSYHHRSIGGYFAAKMRRYQDLIERQIRQEQQALIGALRSGSMDFSELNALNMLNTRYFKLGNEAEEILENPEALGAAWLVEDLIAVSSADEEIETLADLSIGSQAVINTSRFSVPTTEFELADGDGIEITSYNNREAIYKSNNSQPGFAVFSEIYYPHGWQVTVNGKDYSDQLVQVNYVLRGLPLPAGTNEIRFRFEPAAFETGQTVTTIAVWLVFLSLIAAGGFGVKREVAPKEVA